MKHLMPLFPIVLAGMLAGCSIWQQQQQQQPGSKASDTQDFLPPQYLGTVHQVYPAQKFVLLRIIGPLPGAGSTLITHPADGSTARMGNLLVSADTSPRNGMIVADIRSGEVVGGDRVFLYRSIAQPDAEADKKKTVEKPAEPEQVSALRVRTSDGRTPAAPAAPVPSAAPTAPSAAPIPAPVRAEQAAPLPGQPSAPAEAPGYLKDIPDDVSQWN